MRKIRKLSVSLLLAAVLLPCALCLPASAAAGESSLQPHAGAAVRELFLQPAMDSSAAAAVLKPAVQISVSASEKEPAVQPSSSADAEVRGEADLRAMEPVDGYAGDVAERPRVWDYAALFSVAEQASLQQSLQRASQEIGADLAVVTVNWSLDMTQKAYAKQFLLDNGFGIGPGRESVLLLIDMHERLYTIFEYNDEAAGYVLTDDEDDMIRDKMNRYMRKGDYVEAAQIFVDWTVYYAGVDVGGNYDEGSRFSEGSGKNRILNWVIAITVGVLGGAIITFVLVSGRNDDKPVSATRYQVGNLKVREGRDIFTHTTVVTRKISRDDDSGGSGGGGSSGGTSGGGHGGSSSF